MDRIKDYFKKIFSFEKTEEAVKSRRKFAIILTTALVVASGAIISVLFLNEKKADVDTASVLSDSVYNEIKEDDDSEKTAENTTEQTTSKAEKKSVTKKTSKTIKEIIRSSTYKKYDKEVLITAETHADPYIVDFAKAQSYKTRDISKEKYTVRNIDTGKEVTSNGFDMLCQIVNGEMGPSFSSEALKAQAVAAYTTLLYCKSIGQTPELGLNKNYSEKIKSAVEAVEGLVVEYGGKPINAVFSASSAGVTASSLNAWGGSLPYLISVESKYDKLDPNFGTKSKKVLQEVQMKLRFQLGVDLSDDPAEWMSITKTYDGRYVKEVTFCDGQKVTGDFIKALFNLKSNAFTIGYKTGTFTFTTYGYGHGVGMSQEGANLYAIKDGLKFDQILKHYYPGTSVALSKASAKKTTTTKTSTTTKKTTTKKVKTSKKTTSKTTVKPSGSKTQTTTTVTTPDIGDVTEFEPTPEQPPTDDMIVTEVTGDTYTEEPSEPASDPVTEEDIPPEVFEEELAE